MEQNDKKRIYITAGILVCILVLAVAMIALGGKKKDEQTTAGVGSKAESTTEATVEAADTATTTEETKTAQENTGAEQKNTLPQGSGSERAATKVETAPVEKGEQETKSDDASAEAKVVIPAEGYVFFAPDTPKLKSSYKNVAYDTEAELKLLFDYWDAKNLEAVRDLIALPRYEAINATLTGTNDFYYYGARNAEGKPHGRGVAVYADNQYYCGDFADGVRSGKGEWLQRYPAYSRGVVIEHLYTGEWARDLPNGKGQDHYEYDENKMNEEQLFLLNAIGTFKDGAYDGEMYIMIEKTDGSYTEWNATCKEGVFDPYGAPDNHARIAILQYYHDEEHYIWVKPDRNKGFKVEHLIAP